MHLTTSQVARLLCTDTWRVRRLFEDGTLPEPGRFGGYRAIPREMIPAIVDALRARGWLPAAGKLPGIVAPVPSRATDPAHLETVQLSPFFALNLTPWIEEGCRVGKVPWSCSRSVQDAVAHRLRAEGITERESMEETVSRRKEEEKQAKGAENAEALT